MGRKLNIVFFSRQGSQSNLTFALSLFEEQINLAWKQATIVSSLQKMSACAAPMHYNPE